MAAGLSSSCPDQPKSQRVTPEPPSAQARVRAHCACLGRERRRRACARGGCEDVRGNERSRASGRLCHSRCLQRCQGSYVQVIPTPQQQAHRVQTRRWKRAVRRLGGPPGTQGRKEWDVSRSTPTRAQCRSRHACGPPLRLNVTTRAAAAVARAARPSLMYVCHGARHGQDTLVGGRRPGEVLALF